MKEFFMQMTMGAALCYSLVLNLLLLVSLVIAISAASIKCDDPLLKHGEIEKRSALLEVQP